MVSAQAIFASSWSSTAIHWSPEFFAYNLCLPPVPMSQLSDYPALGSATLVPSHNREAQPRFQSGPGTGHGLKTALGHMMEAGPCLGISGLKSQLIQPCLHCFQNINSSQDQFSHICVFLDRSSAHTAQAMLSDHHFPNQTCQQCLTWAGPH